MPDHTGSLHKILSIQFNQDRRLFIVGDNRGFEVFSTDPLKSLRRTVYEDGGLSGAALLHSSNIMALVGGGEFPKYPHNQVILYDDQQQVVAAEIEFRAQVMAVRMRRGLLAAALKNRVFLYALEQKWRPRKLAAFDCHQCDDLEKLVLSVEGGDCAVVAFPGKRPGSVHLVRVDNCDLKEDQNDAKVTQLGIITAHDSPIACLAITVLGDYIATASQKGTLIRIFQVSTSRLRGEFRRGADPAIITCMSFSSDNSKLAVCSDKGTIHIFNTNLTVDNKDKSPAIDHLRHTSAPIPDLLKPVLPKYFSSTWSFAHIHQREGKMVAIFSPHEPNAVIVVRYDGLHFKYIYDENRGGEAVMVSSKAL